MNTHADGSIIDKIRFLCAREAERKRKWAHLFTITVRTSSSGTDCIGVNGRKNLIIVTNKPLGLNSFQKCFIHTYVEF